jgi:hypothetical protein
MSTQTQDAELLDSVNKILDKAFSEIRKKVVTMVLKREKKLSKDMKVVSHASRPPRKLETQKEEDKEREEREEPRKQHKEEHREEHKKEHRKETKKEHRKHSYHRSVSSSDSK